MRIPLLVCCLLGALQASGVVAQEASVGFDTRATISVQGVASSISTEAPRSGSPGTGGYRAVVYPTFKFGDHWGVTAALQSYSEPYFQDSLSSDGYGIEDEVLQATLNYSRVSAKGSLLVRAGQLSTAFGSFLLHYDDADNPLIDMPLEYGYYYEPVHTQGVVGAQIDATRGKWDGRVQFANSSPVNPRSIFAHDQYGNWTGGAGYTIHQGFRVGVSAFHGPYLDRHSPFFYPGEANPNTLPARAGGVDVSWARHHTNLAGEWQTFVMPYKVIPVFREQAGYAEVKQVLSPRWYVAGRGGYIHQSFGGYSESYEGAVGFRPNRLQIIKAGYELRHHETGPNYFENTVTFQLVTSLHLFSLSHN